MANIEIQEIQLLRETLEVQSYSRETRRMMDFIVKKAHQYGAKVELHDGNIYITKGTDRWYPCIVAHTDTVHKIVPDTEYLVMFDKGAYFGWNPVKNAETGVGGDDKVGIYIALAALRDFDAIKVAFFRDEEIGCIGASNAREDFFTDVRYILECDRRGDSDFVDNIAGPLQSRAFRKAVAPMLIKHGYKFSHGMMTDVDALKDIVPVCMANMSCGYYNPHSAKEFVDVFDVERARALVYDIFTNLEPKRWDHVVRGKSSASTVYYGGGKYGWDDEDWGSWRYGGKFGSDNATRGYATGQAGFKTVQQHVRAKDQPRRTVRIIEERKTQLALPAPKDDAWNKSLEEEMTQEGVLFDKTDGPGLYEVYGQFDVYVTMTSELIRKESELPAHISFTYEADDFAVAQIDVMLGLADFESVDDAESWGEKEARSLQLRYPIHMKDITAYKTNAVSVTPVPY